MNHQNIPSRFLMAFAFFLTVFCCGQLVKAGQIFTDIPRTHPYYTAIDHLATEKVIQGYEDQTFKPEDPINRAASLKILLAGSGVPLDAPYQSEAFTDLTNAEEWFIPYIMKAKVLGIVKGNDTDGTFDPGSPVNLAAFTKMLLETNHVDITIPEGQEPFAGIDMSQWYGPYLNRAIDLGIFPPNNLDPARPLNRGEVVRMMYLTKLLKNASQTQFLLNRAEAEMAQIEIYVANDHLLSAKTASRLAYDLTQQAYKNLPDHSTVLGAAKLAAAYDLLIDMLMAALERNKDLATEKGNLVIIKATEAWQANTATQPIGAYLKQRAREIAEQIGVVLTE